MGGQNLYKLNLLGVFALTGIDGERVDVTSKRGQALIAALAVSPGGERSRKWLQNLLWSNRDDAHGAASLRRELSTLRKLVNVSASPLLLADHNRVWIDLNQVAVDLSTKATAGGASFLEGLDVKGEENLEDWLRECRQNLASVNPSALTVEAASSPKPVTKNGDFVRTAIAVLPFSVSSPGQDEALAHGIAEDLIDRLSRQHWLAVIARSSSFALDATELNLEQIGEALNARFIVRGRLTKSAEGMLLAATLDDCMTGRRIWAGQYELSASYDPAQIEEILLAAAAALGVTVDQSLQRSAMRVNEIELSVAENIWRGRWHLHRLTRADLDKAKHYFDTALGIDPISPEALLHQAWLAIWQLWLKRGKESDFKKARKQAQQAIIADPNDARGHMLAGVAEIWLKQPLRAEALLRRAITLNPSLVMAHAQLGSALLAKGEYDQAIECLNRAVTLSPSDSEIFYMLGEIAMCRYLLGQYEAAIAVAEEALSWRGGYWQAHVTRINALLQQGRESEAASAYAELIEMSPSFTVDHIDWLPFLDPDKPAQLKHGLNQVRLLHDNK